MCYGAVVPDGYGASYNPHKDTIVFCVSSFQTCASTSSNKFVTCLGETLRTIKEICQTWNKKRSCSLGELKICSLQTKLIRHVCLRCFYLS